MNAETINHILGIKESFRMPDKLLEIMLDDSKRIDIMKQFMEVGEALDHDWFTEYFQEEHGDRDKLKQDFTPDSICEISSFVAGNAGVTLDLCSGTGGLTLKQWQNGASEFILVEYAERAIPVLLFNLAIRNMKARVYHADALSHEVFHVYDLEPSKQFSNVKQIELKAPLQETYHTCIMNPPYSLKWNASKEMKLQPRFQAFGVPPKSKADYAFILEGLERLEENGTLVAILPHGVLFRGSSEGQIRMNLIKQNLLDMVIGLPQNLFLNTSIPVCIVVLKKNRTNKDILFVDASKLYVKDGKINRMNDEHINELKTAIKMRRNIEKLSNVITYEEIEHNDFNLNIPRYVDITDPPIVPNFYKCCEELKEIQTEIEKSHRELMDLASELVCNDRNEYEDFVNGINILKELI